MSKMDQKVKIQPEELKPADQLCKVEQFFLKKEEKEEKGCVTLHKMS